MKPTISYGQTSFQFSGYQTFPVLPTPTPNQVIGQRDNGKGFTEKLMPGTIWRHVVTIPKMQVSQLTQFYYFMEQVVEWSKKVFVYQNHAGESFNVNFESGSLKIDDYTTGYCRLSFALLEYRV